MSQNLPLHQRTESIWRLVFRDTLQGQAGGYPAAFYQDEMPGCRAEMRLWRIEKTLWHPTNPYLLLGSDERGTVALIHAARFPRPGFHDGLRMLVRFSSKLSINFMSDHSHSEFFY